MSDLSKNSTRLKKVCVQDYNLKELSSIYSVSKYLMRKKMKHYKDQIGLREGNTYTVKQVALIDLPSNVVIVKP